MRPTPDTVRAVGQVIARAACFDDRVTDGDPARIAAWSEAVAPFGFTAADMVEATTAHYRQPDVQTMRVGDLIAGARKIRGDRAEREKADALPALAAPDPQSGGLGIATTGEPVMDAYRQHGAIDRPCGTCGAAAGQTCVNVGAMEPRRLPCMSRLTTAYRLGKATA